MTEGLEAARRHDEAFNSHDAAARVATVTADIESVLPGGMTLRGPDQVAEVVGRFWEALPDVRVIADNEITSGAFAVIEGRLIGTHSGTFRTPQGDIPPSGNQVSLRYASVKRIEGGKIASEHLYYDQMEFLQQIGAMPGARPPGV